MRYTNKEALCEIVKDFLTKKKRRFVILTSPQNGCLAKDQGAYRAV